MMKRLILGGASVFLVVAVSLYAQERNSLANTSPRRLGAEEVSKTNEIVSSQHHLSAIVVSISKYIKLTFQILIIDSAGSDLPRHFPVATCRPSR